MTEVLSFATFEKVDNTSKKQNCIKIYFANSYRQRKVRRKEGRKEFTYHTSNTIKTTQLTDSTNVLYICQFWPLEHWPLVSVQRNYKRIPNIYEYVFYYEALTSLSSLSDVLCIMYMYCTTTTFIAVMVEMTLLVCEMMTSYSISKSSQCLMR